MKSLTAIYENQNRSLVTYTHCLAHCTELIVKNTILHLQMAQIAISNLKHCYPFLGMSLKQEKFFKDIRTKMKLGT